MTTWRLVGVGAGLAITVVISVWAYRVSSAGVRLQLVGDKLGVQGRGVHRLRPNSLRAIRSKESTGSTMGTLLTISFERAGTGVTVLFPSVLPHALYFSETELEADMWLGPDGNALLDQLAPYLAMKPGAQRPDTPSYAFALRARALLGTPKVDSLSIVGDSIAIGLGGRVVAQALAHEIAFTLYSYEQTTGSHSPSLPNAPALVFEILNPPFVLTIGAAAMSLDDHWSDLQEGAKPDYSMGIGELLRLLSILEAGRAKFRAA